MTEPQAESVDVAARVFESLMAIVGKFPEVKTCMYEQEPTDSASLPGITMKTIAGDPVGKRYLDGGRVQNYRFSLHLRQQAQDSQQGLDARQLLEQVASLMEQANIDLGSGRSSWGASIDTLPSRTEGGEGSADWQTELTLKYRTNR